VSLDPSGIGALVHAALVDADQPDRPAQQAALDGHEVVAALPGPAVQEKQRRGRGITPDVDVKPMSGEPVARCVIGAHRGIIARGRATVRRRSRSAQQPGSPRR
jgi:hypothetical protein